MPETKLKVAVVQLRCENGQVLRNLRNAEGFIAQAAAQGARLVLLPELMPNGFELTEDLWNGAERLTGPVVGWLKSNSQRLGIYLGMTFLEADGEDFFNTFVLTDPGGQIAGTVRKSPPASFEAYFYRAGNGAHFIDTDLGRIGVGICYENSLYERLLGLYENSVDLVLQPTSAPTPMISFPLRKKDAAKFDQWIGDMARHYASALGVPVLMANKCGPFVSPVPVGSEQRSVFPGLSTIVDSDGISKGQLGADQGCIVAEVTLSSARKSRSKPKRTGSWVARRPWYAFLYELTQKLGERAYAKNPRRASRARSI